MRSNKLNSNDAMRKASKDEIAMLAVGYSCPSIILGIVFALIGISLGVITTIMLIIALSKHVIWSIPAMCINMYIPVFVCIAGSIENIIGYMRIANGRVYITKGELYEVSDRSDCTIQKATCLIKDRVVYARISDDVIIAGDPESVKECTLIWIDGFRPAVLGVGNSI